MTWTAFNDSGQLVILFTSIYCENIFKHLYIYIFIYCLYIFIYLYIHYISHHMILHHIRDIISYSLGVRKHLWVFANIFGCRERCTRLWDPAWCSHTCSGCSQASLGVQWINESMNQWINTLYLIYIYTYIYIYYLLKDI